MSSSSGQLSSQTQSTIEYLLGEFTDELGAHFRTAVTTQRGSSHSSAYFLTSAQANDSGSIHITLRWLADSLKLLRAWLKNLVLEVDVSKRAVMSFAISMFVNAVPKILSALGVRLAEHQVETISLTMIIAAVSNVAALLAASFGQASGGSTDIKEALVRVCEAWLLSFVPFAVELHHTRDHPCSLLGTADIETKLLLIEKFFEQDRRSPSALVALVPEKWYRQWELFVSAKAVTNAPPGPIDFLVDSTKRKDDAVFEVGRGSWRAVPVEIVEAWIAWFGGGPKIFLSSADVARCMSSKAQPSLVLSSGPARSTASSNPSEPKISAKVRFQSDGRSESVSVSTCASASLWDTALDAAIKGAQEAVLPVAYNSVVFVADVDAAVADVPHSPLSRLIPRDKKRSGGSDVEFTVVLKRSANERRARVGITNLGHTCYIGCVLQAIESFPELRDAIVLSTLMKAAELRAKKSSVSLAVAQCLMLMTQSQQTNIGRGVTIVPVVDPSHVRYAAAKLDEKYMTDEEQDAAEFLSLVLSSIHDELDLVEQSQKKFRERRDDDVYVDPAELSRVFWEDYKKNNNSPISQLLAAQSSSTLQCQNCMRTSTTFDVHDVLPIALPKEANEGVSIAHCLRNAWGCTKLSGDVKWVCPFCKKKVEALMQSALTKSPNILVVQLNRFEKRKDVQTGAITTNKVDVPVSIDEVLHLHRFEGFTYHLVAIILHVGSLTEGHYTCVSRYDDGVWYLHNDSTVARLDKLPERAKEPYILLYRKVPDAQRVLSSSATTPGKSIDEPTEHKQSTAQNVRQDSRQPQQDHLRAPQVLQQREEQTDHHRRREPPAVEAPRLRHDDDDGQVIDVTPKDSHRVSRQHTPYENALILLLTFFRALPETTTSTSSSPIALGPSGSFSLPWLSGTVRLLWGICQQGTTPPMGEREKIAFTAAVASGMSDAAVALLRTVLRQGEDEAAIRRIMEAVVVPELKRIDLLSIREAETTLCLQLWQLLHPLVINWLLCFVPFAAVFSSSASPHGGGVARSVLWSTAPFFRRSVSGVCDEISAVQVLRAIQSPPSSTVDWVAVSKSWVEHFVNSKFVGQSGVYAFRPIPITTHRVVSVAPSRQESGITFAVPPSHVVAIPESLFDVLWMMCGGGPKIRLAHGARGERLAIQYLDCYLWVAELQPPKLASIPDRLHGARHDMRLYK